MEAVGTYCLILDTGFYLDLMDAFMYLVYLGIQFHCLNLMLPSTLLNLGMDVLVYISVPI